MRRVVVLFAFLSFACGADPVAPEQEPDAGTPADTTAPTTTVSPAGREQVGALAITLIANEPGTVRWTLDGSDPRTSATATAAPSPAAVALVPPARITLIWSSIDTAGNEETPKNAQYVLLDEVAGAAITGRLYTNAAMAGGQAVVMLFGRDPLGPQGPGEPLRLETVSTSPSGVAAWKLENLAAGTYWVGAGWWPQSVSGDPHAFSAALRGAIQIDPSNPARARADFVDVYVGRCDPAGHGIEGEVVLAPELLTHTAAVLAFDRPVRTGGGAEIIGASLAYGSGPRRPFAWCVPSPIDAHVLAVASPPGSENPEVVVSHPGNPLHIEGVRTATFHLGLPAPELGTIAGTIRLTGPLPGGSVQLIASDEPLSASSPILATTLVRTGNETEYPYALTGFDDGTYHLGAVVRHADGSEQFVALGTVRVDLPEQRETTYDVELGVGRIVGTVSVSGAPATLGQAIVAASRVGEREPSAYALVTLAPANESGVRSGSFALFGLFDDGYDVFAALDLAGDGEFEDDVAAGAIEAASPSRLFLTGGGEQSTSVTFHLEP